MNVRASTDHFAAQGGLALLHRHWQPERATRTVALVHGLAEHSARYEHVALGLAARGCSVHGFDQRGHGESEGPRVYTPSFATLLDDVERYLAHVRRSDPDLPLILLGHSMGGVEVACLLVERRPEVAAAVLSGPALAPVDSISPLLRGMVAACSGLFPRLKLPSSIDPEGLSRDPEVVAAYMADPLIDKRYSARLVRELLAANRSIEGRGAEVRVPLLIVHGEDDPICPIEGSRRFAEDVTTPGSELRRYPGLRHEVLNEPEGAQVLDDIASWIEKHVPAAVA